MFGGQSQKCEVFDSTSNQFVALKQKPKSFKFCMYDCAGMFFIGNKLIALGHKSSTLVCYDVEKDEWSEKSFELTKDKKTFSLTLAPQIEF